MFTKRRGILALLIIFLLVFLLHLNQEKIQSRPRQTPIDSVLLFIYSPIQKAWHAVSRGFGSLWENYFFLIGLKEENQKLKTELYLKNLYLLSLEERLRIQEQREELDESLQFLGFKGVTAFLIGYDPYAQSQTMWLSEGGTKGVMVDNPVMTEKGLVGRIIKVFNNSSQVLLLVDPHFSVDVINKETRVRALVVGSGRRGEIKRHPLLSHMEFLNTGEAIRAGDLLITSGLSSIYPPGIPVGMLMEQDIEEGKNVNLSTVVLPVVDFSSLEQMIIVTGYSSREEN